MTQLVNRATARRAIASIMLAGLIALSHAVGAQGPPAAPAEIRIGNTVSYTGPNAIFGTFGRTLAAFFDMINDQGGINGRPVVLISYDDMYNPAQTLQLTRRLVEQDNVLLIAGSVGTNQNLAIRDYLNADGVPQLFIRTGAEQFEDPVRYPWTMRWNASFRGEGEAYGRYIAVTYPGAKIGVLYQNDDVGADYMAGLRGGLGDGWEMVALPYDTTDPTVDTQIATLQAEGVDVFVNFASARLAAQALRRLGEIGWHPPQIQGNISASVSGVIVPAGVENAIGNVSAVFGMDPGYAGWAGEPEVTAFHAFMAAYYPEGDPRGVFESGAYAAAYALYEVLLRAGDDLSRENIMRVATSLVDVEVPMLMPGILLNTRPADYAPVEQFQLTRFDGTAFVPFGPLIEVAD